MQRRDARASWLPLDAADDEPRRFLRYLLAAWRKLVPDLGRSLDEALDEPGPFLGTWIVQARIARAERRFEDAMDWLRQLDELLSQVGLARWKRQGEYLGVKVQSVRALLGDRAARNRWGAWVEDDGCLDEGVRISDRLLSEAPFQGAVALTRGGGT